MTTNKPIINNKEKEMIKMIEKRDNEGIATSKMFLSMKDNKTFKSLIEKSLVSTDLTHVTRKYHRKFNELNYCMIVG